MLSPESSGISEDRFEWASKDLTQEVFLQEERHPQCIPEEQNNWIYIYLYIER